MKLVLILYCITLLKSGMATRKICDSKEFRKAIMDVCSDPGPQMDLNAIEEAFPVWDPLRPFLELKKRLQEIDKSPPPTSVIELFYLCCSDGCNKSDLLGAC